VFARNSREDVEMAQAKRPSKRKRAKIGLPAWGAAGMSLAMASGASAAVAPTVDTPQKGNAVPVFTLAEEELSDVSLATFYVFDQETLGAQSLGTQLARACGGGGGGCRGGGGGCRGGGGAGRCAGGGGAGRCAAGRCAAGGCAGRCGAGRCAGGCGGRCAGGCRCGCGVGVVGCGGCSCSCCLSWGACDVSC
jgi:hypothetical protein